jgi:hypothetical protein
MDISLGGKMGETIFMVGVPIKRVRLNEEPSKEGTARELT